MKDILSHNRKIALQVLASIEKGECSALLGPRYAGKSAVLEAVKRHLPRDISRLSIDLCELEQASQERLFADIAKRITNYTRQFVGPDADIAPPSTSHSTFLREVIDQSIDRMQRDLLLIIDHLEKVSEDLLRELMRTLRASYTERQRKEHRLIIVVSGALSLAQLTLGPTSPFRNILRTILIGDLTHEESRQLIQSSLEAEGIDSSKSARKKLLEAAQGDPYLINLICEKCAEVKPKRLIRPTVERNVQAFIQDEAFTYRTFQEAIRLIETDRDVLHCIRLLLQQDKVPKQALPLPLSPDIDPLYLTGLVREVEHSYELRNEIYRVYLTNYFTPARVAHLLVMMGCWEDAIDHLEANIQAGDDRYRADLLSVTIQSMYASETMEQVVYYFTRGLSAHFGVQRVQIWYFYNQEDVLKLIPPTKETDTLSPDQTIAITDRNRLEVQVLKDAYARRGPHGERGIPLLIPPRRQPIGVIVIRDAPSRLTVQQERELNSYLNQAARAIQEIKERQERKELAETLRKSAKIFSASLELEKVTHAILEQMRGVLPFDSASIQLVDDAKTKLQIVAATGFNNLSAVQQLAFPLDDEQFPNTTVWHTKKPLRYKDVHNLHYFADPSYHADHVRGWLGVPLIVRDEAIGVITLDSEKPRYYTTDHEGLATIFAGQAALAIENARLFEKTHKQAKELATLADVVREISAGTTENPRHILNSIVQGACKTTGANCAVVYPFLPESENYEYDPDNIAAYGLQHPKPFKDSIHPGVTGGQLVRTVIEQDVRQVSDIEADDDARLRKSRFMQREAIRAFAAVRLPVSAGKPTEQPCLGVLFVNFRTPHEFNAEELKTIRLFANHAAIAIRNARLFQRTSERLEKRIEEIERLQEIDLAISATFALPDILAMILDSAMEMTNAPFGTVQLVRDEGQTLEFVIGKGAEMRKGTKIKMGQGVTGIAAQKGRTYCIADVTVPEWANIYLAYIPDMRSELAVPMVFEDEVIGVINIEKEEVGAFGDEDKRMVKRLAQQAAIAIHNAMRYEELEKAYQALEKTRDRLVASEAVAFLGLLGADWQHTINQKTFSIRQYTDALKRWLRQNEVAPETFNTVLQTLDHIEEVTQSIQEVKFTSQMPADIPQAARARTDGEPVAEEHTLIDKELKDIVEHWCSRRQDISAQLMLNCPNVFVAIGSQWLSVAMEKLLNNALKAMPRGGPLTVHTKRKDDVVHVTLRDTGKGIPEDVRKDFLKRAVRNGDSGTGMGALIARFVIQKHGGNLTLVDSRLGWGTELLMTLPVAQRTEQ